MTNRRKFLTVVAILSAASASAQDDRGKKKAAFEVASIKPAEPGQRGARVEFDAGGRYVAKNITAKMLIQQAYGVRDFQIVGAPSWVGNERLDIIAKPESGTDLNRESLKSMMQGLLADRFKISAHKETKELPVYSLVVGKNGPKLKDAAAGPDQQTQRMGRGQMTLEGANMEGLAVMLASQLGREVIDNTGLKGHYDITLEWTPDDNATKEPGEGVGRTVGENAAPPDNTGPSLFTAVQESLGLKLESSKGPVTILVVDHIEKASEN